jgi:hypothetical protein
MARKLSAADMTPDPRNGCDSTFTLISGLAIVEPSFETGVLPPGPCAFAGTVVTSATVPMSNPTYAHVLFKFCDMTSLLTFSRLVTWKPFPFQRSLVAIQAARIPTSTA